MKKTYTVLLCSVFCFLASCNTVKEVEYVDRDFVHYETSVQHDTVIQNIHDSIYHTVFKVGDTVYNTKYVEKIKYRDRVAYKTDTVTKDSVQTIYKEKFVEKKSSSDWLLFVLIFIALLLFYLFV